MRVSHWPRPAVALFAQLSTAAWQILKKFEILGILLKAPNRKWCCGLRGR